MTALTLRRSAIAASVLALLAACGGGEERNTVTAREFAMQAATAIAPALGSLPASSVPTTPAAPAAAVTITPQMVFDYAQKTFGSLFPTDKPITSISGLAYEGKVFEVRGYANGNFLGTSSNNEIWGLGPYTNNVLTKFGSFADYACQIAPSSCVAEPPPPTTASYNECVDPATSSLPTGFRVNLVFTYLGLLTGDQTLDSVIDGPATFEGQSATQATTTSTGSNTVSTGGFSVTATTTTKTRSYQQKGSNGLVKTLGALVDATISTPLPAIPGLPSLPPTVSTTSSKVVHNPASENIEYTLGLGKSLDKTVTIITTVTAGPGSTAPLTTTSTTRFTFEAKETITLANGKSYSACRYKSGPVDGSNPATTWYMVGKGVPLRTQSTADGKTQTVELKSGTYNGTPL